MRQSIPLVFSCSGNSLYGVMEFPENTADRAVLIVVGGPQYRAGSHRQFVLLARHLAEHGYPVLRFDHRGVGDSGGEPVMFDEIDSDIRDAIDMMLHELPSIKEVVIWGLCDAAAAALMYAAKDERVKGIVLLNPWVRSDKSLARAYLTGYYLTQLRSRKFWRGLLTGRLNMWKAAQSFAANAVSALRPKPAVQHTSCQSSGKSTEIAFQQRMKLGLRDFDGQVLIILSGEDVTASEFRALVARDRNWKQLLKRKSVRQESLVNANHTFSCREWRGQVAGWTLEWLRSW